jgi:hypothetical protein
VEIAHNGGATLSPRPRSVISPSPVNSTFDILQQSVPSGHAIHVNAYGLFNKPSDTFDRCIEWDFSDPQQVADPRQLAKRSKLDLGASFPGPVAAHRYLPKGDYTIAYSEHQRGSNGQPITQYVRQAKQTITITPPARTVFFVDGQRGLNTNGGLLPTQPLKTADAAAARLADNTELRFASGQTFELTESFNCQHQNVVITSSGTGSPPVIKKTTPGNIVSCWAGKTRNVSICNLVFDSASTPQTTAGGIAYQLGCAVFGILRGMNISIVDVGIANLAEGPRPGSDAQGVLILRCYQTQAWGIRDRFVWLEGSDVVLAGCTILNSVNQSPVRMDNSITGSTGGHRVAIVANRIGQLLDKGHGRPLAMAALTVRYGDSIFIARNLTVDGELSLNSPGWPNVVSNADVRENYSVSLTGADAYPHVRPGCTNIALQDNQSWQAQGPCFWISPQCDDPRLNVDYLWYRGNRAFGWGQNSRREQVDPYKVPALAHFVNEMNSFVEYNTLPPNLPAVD